MAKRSIKKQKGRGQAQSMLLAPAPLTLIDVIRSDEENPEIKSDNIRDAIDQGFDVNERDQDGSSPLIELMINTNQDGMDFMYYQDLIPELIGNDINYIGPNGSALHYAILNIQGDYMETLLQNGANINLRNNDGETPLFIASIIGNSHDVRRLLILGANPNIPDNQGRLPIQVASLRANFGAHNRFSIIGFFCDRGFGVGSPECQEYQAWLANLPIADIYRLQRRHNGFEGPPNFGNNAMNEEPQPQIIIPDVSQGPKTVPKEKMTNSISYEDIKNGDEIIVIREANGSEFFYKVNTITQWFATKDAEGNPKTNPGSGSVIQGQDQVTRWTARIQNGGRTKKAKKGKKAKKTKKSYRS
jgi:hypothetical protein